MHYPHILADFPVRSSAGFAPLYHGTYFYTVVPDSAFSAAEQNSGPGARPPPCLWSKTDGDKLAENLALDH